MNLALPQQNGFLRCRRTYYVPVPMYVVRRCKSAEWIGNSPGKASRSPFLLFAFFSNPPFAISAQGRSSHSFYFKDLLPLCAPVLQMAWLALVRLCKGWKGLPISLGRIKKGEWVHYDKEAISIKPLPPTPFL